MDEPSGQLIALLERLRLVTAGQLLSHRPHVRRLAGDLGSFDSVWIDALAQARQLSPFQAREINSGRGESLAVGPLVLVRPQGSFGFAECFAARHIESGESVRLYLIGKTHIARETAQRQLAELADRCRRLTRGRLLPLQTVGVDAERIWATTPPSSAVPVADWMIENGRFPPEVVLFMAQEMTAALTELAAHSIVHGDISAASLFIERGRVMLAHPGLRGIVRPAEGYAHHDLFPAAYDYLAPERIASGTTPSVAGDVYACGALWWHLLAGRPPFAGGNSLTKLQSVHAARTVDVRRLAPETPERLAAAIAQCLSREPNQRPSSFAELAVALGPAVRHGSAALARLMNDRQRVRSVLGSSPSTPRARPKHAQGRAATRWRSRRFDDCRMLAGLAARRLTAAIFVRPRQSADSITSCSGDRRRAFSGTTRRRSFVQSGQAGRRGSANRSIGRRGRLLGGAASAGTGAAGGSAAHARPAFVAPRTTRARRDGHASQGHGAAARINGRGRGCDFREYRFRRRFDGGRIAVDGGHDCRFCSASPVSRLYVSRRRSGASSPLGHCLARTGPVTPVGSRGSRRDRAAQLRGRSFGRRDRSCQPRTLFDRSGQLAVCRLRRGGANAPHG